MKRYPPFLVFEQKICQDDERAVYVRSAMESVPTVSLLTSVEIIDTLMSKSFVLGRSGLSSVQFNFEAIVEVSSARAKT
jgi:hypothetical protein